MASTEPGEPFDVYAEEPIEWPGFTHPKGTVAIVTGSGSGMGQATSIIAAILGYEVAAWDISPEGHKRTLARAGEKLGSHIHPFIGDVFEWDSVKASMDETVKQLGKPLLLCNMASPGRPYDKDDFDGYVTKGLGSMEKVTRAFMMTDPDRGASVVNISSTLGALGGGHAAHEGDGEPNWVGAHYAAAKAGIVGYTRWCATQLGYRARFNAIAPGGGVVTPRNRPAIRSGGASFADMIAHSPISRFGRQEEIAAGVMFLWSPAASYVNGQLIVMDGGVAQTMA